MQYRIHTDGGARGNPGPAAIGVVIEELSQSGQKIATSFGKKIGETTNNVAEYTAVIEALRSLQKMKSRAPNDEGVVAEFFLDSLLVVQQLNGVYKVKDSQLRLLVLEVKSLEQEIGGHIRYTAVRREQNKEADRLVNVALDALM